VGEVNSRETVEFPNTHYEDVCRDDRRIFPDWQMTFSFVVMDINGQSATLKPNGRIWCDVDNRCNTIRTNYQRGEIWKLEADKDGKIQANFWSSNVNGGYSK